jgi:hypothetical protein
MDADAIAALRAQARTTGGSWIGLQEVGDWFAGTVTDPSHQVTVTEYGETEELMVSSVTLNDQPQEGTFTFRLSRSVLRAELGTEADDDVVGPGWSVYVVYRGQRRGKSGRDYHAYDIAKKAPDLDAVAAVAKSKAKADGDDIPF